MKLLVFTVYDKAVGAHLQPMFFRAKGEAQRAFADAVAAEDSRFRAHAEDYLLMECGEFDDNTGLFASYDPVRVVGALELVPEDPGKPDIQSEFLKRFVGSGKS